MRFIAIILGIFFAYTPQFIANGVAYMAGGVIYYIFPRRRRTMLSNLYYAFPDKSKAWRRRIAIESCRRMAEWALFLVSSPFFSRKRIQRILELTDSAQEFLKKSTSSKSPQVFLVPHFSLTEAVALYRGCVGGEIDTREVGVIFRPLKNESLNEWIQETRERLGVKLLSRKEGFSEAINILRRNGTVGILFDQNAGDPGVLGIFFGRLASTSQLPDLLTIKTRAEAHVVYTERMGFWKAKVHTMRLPDPKEVPLRVTANEWLEGKLKENDNYCSDWLWFHSRWRAQHTVYERYSINAKKMDLDWGQLRCKTRFWFRMPNWLGDVVMALPLIMAIKKGRPDAEITLLAQKPLIPLLEKLGIADRVIGLPKKDWKYFFRFWKLRDEYPETEFLFTNSERGDIEAWIIGAPQRFGMERPGKKRRLLTNTWAMPEGFDETQIHQMNVWEICLRHFGLKEAPDIRPFRELFSDNSGSYPPTIGLICGTENNPEKRWPIAKWRELIELIIRNYPGYKIHLYGTARDKEITRQVASGFDDKSVLDLAGRTDLIRFAEGLARCEVVVCNDTGGMHLANALGTPVIAIFGPTNPVRTGPVFEGKKVILQPDGCPPTGGVEIAGVLVPRVFQALEEFIAKK